MEHIARKDAFELLKKYNKDQFHIQHALLLRILTKKHRQARLKFPVQRVLMYAR